MAIDRLLAVSKPAAYYRSRSMMRVYLTSIIALLCGGFFGFFAMYGLDSSPALQCSTGAAATQLFVNAWAVFGAIMAILIFAVYIATTIFLIKRSQVTDHNVVQLMQRQKKVFISISLILLSYFIFWCLPLFSLIIIETAFNNPLLLGYISLVIALCSGINSCVGIFIYLAKHQELREYFFKLFPKTAKIKGVKVAQVGGTHSQPIGSTINTVATSRRPSLLVPQVVIN
uniref:G-protein coupled receptors family 1 profile domain-containing protein n=1 Tax=Acrobeloides nanus TaxID=290746 RepID=A0A914D1V2_9BILA